VTTDGPSARRLPNEAKSRFRAATALEHWLSRRNASDVERYEEKKPNGGRERGSWTRIPWTGETKQALVGRHVAGGGTKPQRDEARSDLPTRYCWIFEMRHGKLFASQNIAPRSSSRAFWFTHES